MHAEMMSRLAKSYVSNNATGVSLRAWLQRFPAGKLRVSELSPTA